MGGLANCEVCQLLSARPQVIYPVGLNGTDEPVTTTLPKQLHSSASIITYEHPYMRINIPPPPLEELGCIQPCQLMKQTLSQQPIHPEPPQTKNQHSNRS